MAKVSSVAQFLKTNSAKAKLLTESHYYDKDVFGWVKNSNFINKNNGKIIGNMTSTGRQHSNRASHKLVVNLPNLTEIRTQKIEFTKISDKNGIDKFIPQKIITEIKTIEEGKKPIIQKFERICEKLKLKSES